jgi:hypothetical protein
VSIVFKCDFCGQQIGPEEPYVTLEVQGGKQADKRWSSGYAGHYHTADEGRDCWERVKEALDVIHGWGPAVESLPVAERSDPDAQRPTADEFRRRFRSGTPLVSIVRPVQCQALYQANLIALEEVADRTEEEVRAIDGVGYITVAKLMNAMDEHGLWFRNEREKV